MLRAGALSAGFCALLLLAGCTPGGAGPTPAPSVSTLPPIVLPPGAPTTPGGSATSPAAPGTSPPTDSPPPTTRALILTGQSAGSQRLGKPLDSELERQLNRRFGVPRSASCRTGGFQRQLYRNLSWRGFTLQLDAVRPDPVVVSWELDTGDPAGFELEPPFSWETTWAELENRDDIEQSAASGRQVITIADGLSFSRTGTAQRPQWVTGGHFTACA